MMKKNGWLIFGFGATFAYTVAAIGFGFIEVDFIKNFAALPLNNQGDALAGFFAPLAFLWLFVATMIQSQELALQRKEIADNRAVMQEQSDAAKEQAEQAKEQAKFLEAQTKAMQDQTALIIEQVKIARDNSERESRLALFEKRIEIYNALVELDRLTWHRRMIDHTHVDRVWEISRRAEFLFGTEVVDWLDSVAESLDYIRTESSRLDEFDSGIMVLGPKRTPSKEEAELEQKVKEELSWAVEQFWGVTLKEKLGDYLSLYREDQPEQQSNNDASYLQRVGTDNQPPATI
ncbi:hypothetical protein KX729_09265 [Rhizobium sp. XQZ8]|uniref:hypothetical protein n=1 Tax=Rhizobium populisoli TaxID=2859785 RepID=UPI001CA5281F|nr:hypothetical protein [Rhizobium populisoli]MBW6421628.1 hypothetical protein [Rhizobium populisoli]